MKFGTIHRKGLLTLCLIILTELTGLCNAVTFKSTYQKWSNRYKKKSKSTSTFDTEQERASNNIKKPIEENESCCRSSSSTEFTSNFKPPTLGLYRHSRARLASLHGSKLSHCTQKMLDCCSHSCASTCANMVTDNINTSKTAQTIVTSLVSGVIDLRGGHMIPSEVIDAATTILPQIVPTPYSLPLNMWKVIFQIFLTAMNVLCWLIPLRSKKISENKLALSLANAFSGGVFLSLAFGHLIPECVHGFEGYNEALPFMIVLGGYLLIFFVEKVAFDAHGLMHTDDAHDEPNNKSSTGDTDVTPGGLGNGRSAIILLGALAVHSILEMTALGLADTFADSALLSLSIALHQPAESIALLVSFLKSGMPKDQIVVYLSVFSAMGPIGVALGMAVNEFAAPIVDAIMLAMVAGTFVYVGATEVIPEEWEDQEHKWKKIFSLLAGIVSIFAITQYTMTLEGSH